MTRQGQVAATHKLQSAENYHYDNNNASLKNPGFTQINKELLM